MNSLKFPCHNNLAITLKDISRDIHYMRYERIYDSVNDEQYPCWI